MRKSGFEPCAELRYACATIDFSRYRPECLSGPRRFGRMGCAWRGTNVEDTDLEAVIQDLWEGQYSNPVRVIGFNVSEGWVRDVSEAVARRLRERCAEEVRELLDSPQQFVEQAAET